MKVLLKNLSLMFSAPFVLFLLAQLATLDWNLYLEPKWASLAGIAVAVAGYFVKLIFAGSIETDFEDAK